MALVEMKKVTLLAMNQDKARLMSKMQQLGCVQVTPHAEREDRHAQSEREQGKLEEFIKQIDRLDLTIKRLSPYDKHKRGMLDPRRVASQEQVQSVLANKGEVMAVVERVEDIERTRGDLRAQEARARAQIDQLAPWESLPVPLDKLGKTKTAQLFLVSLPQKNLQALEQGMDELGSAQMEEVSRASEQVHLLMAAHQSAHQALDQLLKDAEAVRVSFPDLTGMASLQLDLLNAKLKRIDEVRAQLQREVEKLADNLPELRLLRDVLSLERDQLLSGQQVASTQSAFMITGWIPDYRCEELEKALKKCAPLTEVEFSEPSEDEKPPTMLRNKKLVTPFESIVKMFDYPDPHGIDPTLIMLPFWLCFFGMMVSDAGYGIILGLLCGYAFYRLKGQGIGRMAFIIALGGLATVFWGAMYGGWFSISGIEPILFAPMEEPLYVLIMCLAIGVVQLVVGLGVAAYMNFKRGKPLDALYDQASWLLLLLGLGCLMINQTLGMVLAGAGVLLILLFAGRAKKNPISRIVSGLGSLYGITSYLSDILSYARLFGMGLATGVIGMVVNTLALMLWGSPVGKIFTIVILIFGHTLNLLINTLGAYVHSCRLQYIEFFGKFYEGGGTDFKPLQSNTRYVDIAPGDN